MKSTGKRILSLVLAFVMVCGLLPVVQLAAEAADLPKLAAPSAVEIGYRMEYQYDETTQEGKMTKVAAPGAVIYQPAQPHQNQFRFELYLVGEEEPVSNVWVNYGAGFDAEDWLSEDHFRTEDLESGTYYATVCAKGDGINYADSDPVKTAEWTYVKPDAKLGTCTNLTWNGTEISWEYPENTGGYFLNLYYAPDLKTEPTCVSGSMGYFDGDYVHNTDDLKWYTHALQEHGIGYYFFQIKPLSADITKWCNGEWSELSEPYYLETAPVNNQLQEIIAADKSGDEILEAVQEMDNEALKQAMLADPQAASNVAQLEEKLGGAAAVEVSKEAAAFAGEDVSIVGANLNKASADAAPVKLVIDKPEKDHILPTQYNNAVSVKFSMDLENVENTENLAVPVKITLPVPATINPQFLVVLHYHADGSVEEVWPYIFSEGDKTYASFVLTSFSDFTLTEYVGMGNPFTDVAEDAYYFEPVLWAVDTGITTGMSETTFVPEGTCTRAQIVTFLWRAFGSEKPTSANNPFTDVPAGQWYTDAVLWAVEMGITTGTSATTFSPDAGCTRGQVATFLWRALGEPAFTGGNPFTDVASGAYYYNPVLWAVENGITNGMSEGIFAPDATCTRGQIVTFLFRALTQG